MESDSGLTLREFAEVLDPPVTIAKLRALICIADAEPCGYRRTGHRGHPAAVYPADLIMDLHAAVAPWLVKRDRIA